MLHCSCHPQGGIWRACQEWWTYLVFTFAALPLLWGWCGISFIWTGAHMADLACQRQSRRASCVGSASRVIRVLTAASVMTCALRLPRAAPQGRLELQTHHFALPAEHAWAAVNQ